MGRTVRKRKRPRKHVWDHANGVPMPRCMPTRARRRAPEKAGSRIAAHWAWAGNSSTDDARTPSPSQMHDKPSLSTMDEAEAAHGPKERQRDDTKATTLTEPQLAHRLQQHHITSTPHLQSAFWSRRLVARQLFCSAFQTSSISFY